MNLNKVLEKTSRMFGRTRKEIEIHTSYKPDLGTVAADRGQIEQVLLNMYVNAWQAMSNGGKLYLHTENITVDDGHVRAKQGGQGDYVRISITDTGTGMDKETQKRIFEPFFTTRRWKGVPAWPGICLRHYQEPRWIHRCLQRKGKGDDLQYSLAGLKFGEDSP